jgi:hypothetical protein
MKNGEISYINRFSGGSAEAKNDFFHFFIGAKRR